MRKLLLEKFGHTVITAETAEQALSLFQLAQFDLVLCDYYLHGHTGADVAQKLRAMRPGIPFLLISGELCLPDELPAVDAMFTKGGSPERLLEMIGELLAGRAASSTSAMQARA